MKFEKLGNIIDIRKGKKVSRTLGSPGKGRKRYLQIKDLRNDDSIQYTDELHLINVETDDIIIAWDGANAGTIGYGKAGIIGSTLARMAIKPSFENIINASYLGRFLQSQFSYLQSKTTGATIPHVEKKSLMNLGIPLPSMDEQAQIVAVLDKAQSILQKRRKSIELLDELLRATFLEMFDNFFEGETSPLGLLGKVQGGLQVSYKRASNPIEVPYLRVANVYRGYLDLVEIKKIRVKENELERVKLKTGDLLIVEGHGNINEIGRCAQWDGSIDNCAHQNHLIRFRCDSTLLNPFYAEYLINSWFGKIQMANSSKTTSGLNTISTNNVRNFKVPIPPIELQERFGSTVRKSQLLNKKLQHSLLNSEMLFQSLLQKAFNGELSINEAEIFEYTVGQQAAGKIIQDSEQLGILVKNLNAQDFQSLESYQKAQSLLFELLEKEAGPLKQVYDKDTQNIIIKPSDETT